MAKRMGISPITNKIYLGTVDEKNKRWIGKKEDVTDMAISNVFEWFYNEIKDNEAYEVRFPDVKGYVLKMVKEE